MPVYSVPRKTLLLPLLISYFHQFDRLRIHFFQLKTIFDAYGVYVLVVIYH